MPQLMHPKLHGPDHESGGDDEVEYLKLTDRKHASKHEAGDDPLTLTKIDTKACRIATGQYVGDGTTSHAITGVGFKPKFLIILVHVAVETGPLLNHMAFDKMGSGLAWDFYSSYQRDNRILSLDADGFTVSDDGANSDPNADGFTYDYIAIG